VSGAPELRDWLVYLAEMGYGELAISRAGAPPGTSPGARAASGGTASGGGPGEAPSARRAERGASLATALAQALEPAAANGGERGDRGTAGDGSAGPAPPPLERTSAPLSREERSALLAALTGEVAACRACRLCEGRDKTVFGSGNPEARLMVIGEGPGADEDRQGLPFVGKAGELLTRILAAIGLERDQVYIANVVKCRPPNNREPQPDEVAACRRYLDRQLEVVRPRVVVALGRTAAQTLLGNDQPLGRLRGRWYRVAGADLRVTYHPAALLRNPDFKRPTWEDMQLVRDRLLGQPSTEPPSAPDGEPAAGP
jgi:uracil-DNA glycosylase family 4